MNTGQLTLGSGAKLHLDDSLELTVQSLLAYGPSHEHWAIAWSGGKDSTALLTVVLHLLETGRVPRPTTLTVFYADTRLELHPLYVGALQIQAELRRRGVDTRTVMAPLDKRFLLYVLGRGVPPPNNRTLRWCTRQIKVDPMAAELRRLVADRGGKVLMLTGVRQGESAIRDGRIAMSCGRDGGECGQGWYQETLPDQLCDTLAPLLHWRVCHVWEWLRFFAPSTEFGRWPTAMLAEAYGGEEAEELNARTGCVGCPLATKDTALDAVVAQGDWAYLAPLKELRPLWRELRRPGRRLRQPGGEHRKDGRLAAKQQRLGPLTLETRIWALERVLDIQRRVNEAAVATGRPRIDLLDAEEEARVRELIAAGTWPDRWTGREPTGDVMLDRHHPDGTVEPLLPWAVR